MEETQTDFSTQLWLPIRQHRWWIVLGSALAVAMVLLWQAFNIPQYTATAVVSPTDQGPSAMSSQLSGLSGLAGIAGVSLGNKGSVSEFEKFQFLLFSDRLGVFQAQRSGFLQSVFADRWDKLRQNWRRPNGFGQLVKDGLWPIFGLPTWLPPDGRDIAKEYDRRLATRKLGESQLLQITYRDPDPARAEMILGAIIRDANELLRRDAQKKARSQSTYLRQQLALAQVQEYRENLAGLLARQEQTLVLTSTSLPFAADVLQADTLSKEPTSQRPILYAGIALVVGFCLSAFIAILVGVRPRGSGERHSTGPLS